MIPRARQLRITVARLDVVDRHQIPALHVAAPRDRAIQRSVGALARHLARRARHGRDAGDRRVGQPRAHRAAGADEALAAEVAVANTGLAALQLCAARGVPLGDRVAETARDQALSVLRGAPVVVDVVCIDRAGTVVGRSTPR